MRRRWWRKRWTHRCSSRTCFYNNTARLMPELRLTAFYSLLIDLFVFFSEFDSIAFLVLRHAVLISVIPLSSIFAFFFYPQSFPMCIFREQIVEPNQRKNFGYSMWYRHLLTFSFRPRIVDPESFMSSFWLPKSIFFLKLYRDHDPVSPKMCITSFLSRACCFRFRNHQRIS